ncbi:MULTISPECIES: DUF2922 family protein [Levilactobacillus]|uniref:DUF2922 family protein n=1 Tax=Levilactobacillus tongjiangensis TaxID=2486023 RepID=A0ABW1SQA3_9LACO|nr:DUF2922 family protein [Levilactobacillus tongjiangensis]
MKTLELNFKGSDLRIKHLRLKYVNTELTTADVEAIMAQIATAKLFAKDDVNLYAEPLTADVVETTKQTIYPLAVPPVAPVTPVA